MITHIYTLNTTNQLVDINDTYTSFTTMYSVTCDNMQDEFEYGIASQNMLDSKKVHFKKAIGYIEDSVTYNEGKFENWYLILRANKDTPCKVILEMTSLDVSPPMSPSVQRQNPTGRSLLESEQPLQTQSSEQSFKQRRRPPPKRLVRPRPTPPPPLDSDDESNDDETLDNDITENFEQVPQQPIKWWWYLLVILVIILIIVFLLWWFGKLHLLPFYKYFKPTTNTISTKVLPVEVTRVVSPQPPQSPQSPLAIPVTPTVTQVSTPIIENPVPDIQIVEPEIFTAPPPPPQLDANFINEMRELKLNF